MNISETALKRPVATMMIFTCLLVIGLISSQLLPLEFFPDIDAPFVGVEIPYPGSTPEEVERRITQPAEEALATISGIKRMQSDSRESGASVNLEFDWGADSNVKALEAREKLDGVRHLFPADLERFFVSKWSASDQAVLQVRISSTRDLSNAYDMLERNLKRRLERLPGVSKVELYGTERKQIQIRLSTDRVIAHRVDIAALVRELEQSNFLITAGRITDGNTRFVVRPVGELTDIEQIKNLVVTAGGVRLSDIAEVTYGAPKLDYGRHLDRKYAVGLDVYKEAGANTVEVTRRVVGEISQISKIPEMAGIRIYYMDNQGEGIVDSLNELLKSGALGGLLAMVVLFFFLRRVATTLIVALAVPFSLLIAMAFMYFTGLSLNILTMMGLMLAVGMLVDNAVVVTESIHRHQLVDEVPSRSILKGVNEVGLAITAGTITTVIVFLPTVLNTRNEVGIYLKHVAISMSIAMGASLLLAATIVPLLVSRVSPPRRDRKKTSIDRLVAAYRTALDWSLSHRAASVGVSLLLLLSIAVPMQFVKKSMFDQAEDRRLRLHYHINGSYTLEKVEEAVDTYEAYLFANQDEFEIGSIYTYFNGSYAMSTILLKKGRGAKKSVDAIREAIRKDLPNLAITEPSFEWRSASGQDQSVRVQLAGKSSEELAAISREVAWGLSKVKGLTDVRSEAEIGTEEVHVVVDRLRARQYGFSTQEIAGVVAAAMRGINLRPFQGDETEIPVRVELQDKDRQTLEDLENLPLFNARAEPVKLASLAGFSVRRGPQNIHRENRTTSIGVTANLDGITMEEAKQKIGAVLGNFNLPPGYTWNYGQTFDEEQQTFRTMIINIVLALVLIYFVMAALFESLLFPAAIWTQVIYAVVGVYWFFMITGTKLNMMAMIGILILIGVVVNNGIVLIDYVNQLRRRGLSRHDALVEGGQARVRPILMTAGTTVLSLIPLCMTATQIGGGGPPYFPMARAIVGGLAFSTVITLLILPTTYSILDDWRAWAARTIKAGTAPL